MCRSLISSTNPHMQQQSIQIVANKYEIEDDEIQESKTISPTD